MRQKNQLHCGKENIYMKISQSMEIDLFHAGYILMIYSKKNEVNMIKSITMHSVVCDRCGKSFIDEFNGIVAWLDEGTAKDKQ